MTDRYGSEKMHEIWDTQHKYDLWLSIWTLIARAQNLCCVDDTFTQIAEQLVTLSRLRDNYSIQNMSISAIQALEQVTHHELEAARRHVESQIASNLLHFGCTSSDIQDNADAIRLYQSQQLIIKILDKLLQSLSDFVYHHRSTICIGQTHIQPAEITTVGYRFATMLEELLYRATTIPPIIAKGVTGAVGTESLFTLIKTRASIAECFQVMMINQYPNMKFGITSSQTSLRFAEYDILNWLAGIAMACSRFALNIRILHSQGEITEGFHNQQVGSSAMPHKRNPIKSENVCGLARMVEAQTSTYWHTASNQILERTLDDSSVRRIALPLAFNLTEEILIKSLNIVDNLYVNNDLIARNVNKSKNSSFALSAALLKNPDISRTAIHSTISAHGADKSIHVSNESLLTFAIKKVERLCKITDIYLATKGNQYE